LKGLAQALQLQLMMTESSCSLLSTSEGGEGDKGLGLLK
jgi:hypothetical protein